MRPDRAARRRFVERADMQAVIEQLHPLGTEARQRCDRAEFARKLALQRFEHVEAARGDDGGDLAGEVLADAGQLRQILARRHACR